MVLQLRSVEAENMCGGGNADLGQGTFKGRPRQGPLVFR